MHWLRRVIHRAVHRFAGTPSDGPSTLTRLPVIPPRTPATRPGLDDTEITTRTRVQPSPSDPDSDELAARGRLITALNASHQHRKGTSA